MKKMNTKKRVLGLLVLMVLALVVLALSVSAAELVWDVMAEEGDGYRLEDKYNKWESATEADGTAYMYNVNSQSGALLVLDENNTLGSYSSFAVEGDFYFDSFPYGTRDGATASESPLSFLAWIYTDVKTGSTSKFNAVRIDDYGFIHVGSGRTDIKLALKTQYTVRCVFEPQSGRGELFLDGKKKLDFTFTPFDAALYASHAVRFFDGYFNWDVKMKNLTVETDSDYVIRLKREDAADFLGYQVTKPEGGTFSLRTLLGVDSRAYGRVGYEVLLLNKDASGNTLAESVSRQSNLVYTDVMDGNGNVYNVKELAGYSYVAAIPITGIPSTPSGDRTEIVIRPYVLTDNGIRRYGLSTSLVFTGEVDGEGYPVLSLPEGERYSVGASGDTYIYTAHPEEDYGSVTALSIRNTGSEASDLFRAAYFKFTLDAQALRELESAVAAKLRICMTGHENNPSREQCEMILQAAGSNWDEHTLNYNNYKTLAPTGQTLYQGTYTLGSYFTVDILSYLKKQTPGADGSVTVAFRLLNEGNSNAIVAYAGSKESNSPPVIELEKTLYYPTLNLPKSSNKGYEPWGYAEHLVNEWFDGIVDKVYLKDENGNLVYHEIDEFAPVGYDATTATGDFTRELFWKYASPWNTDASKGYTITDADWKTARFARTLSTLGSAKSSAFLSSSLADTLSTYDVYGGISNAGFQGKVTGFFHTERIGERTYVIDPLGNPYFALGINTVDLGHTQNQKDYALEVYGTEQAYYESMTAALKETGINLTYGGGALLEVEDGLSSVIGLSVVLPYMSSIGAGRNNFSNGFAHNDTMNVFDPDFVTATDKNVATAITAGGYANNPRVFGYTSDNELPSGSDLLLRYLTLDPTEPVNSFSYAVAWTWLAHRTGNPSPTLDDLYTFEDAAKLNDEFLAFVYARYYRVTREAIEKVDTNHMYMGSRINGTLYTCEDFHRVCGYYLDIITANLYGGLNPVGTTITGFYRNAGIPFMVTEFFAKGMDAIDANGYKLANSTGAGILVQTQADRADYYEHYALAMLESKACVGWGWYCFRDNDQSVFTSDGENRLIMLDCSYGTGAKANTFMDVATGEILTAAEVGAYETVYKGADIHSNQNINKGLYNGTFSSTVAVYTYDRNGKLTESEAYDVEHPASRTPAAGTVLTGKNGVSYTVGEVTHADGGRTETVLTVYKGQYVAFADAIRNVSDHLIGLVNYFDAE
ncbi:MAG: DNRLRE domain-containing protein [Clostridia bacterium]|nr:DNRLRE domain-containing protein [Clostridia bacterium]